MVPGRGRLLQLNHLPRELTEIHCPRRDREVSGTDPARIQQITDQSFQALGRLVDELGFRLHVHRLLAGISLEDLRVAAQSGERGAQVVSDGTHRLVQVLLGCLSTRRMLIRLSPFLSEHDRQIGGDDQSEGIERHNLRRRPLDEAAAHVDGDRG